MAINFTVQDNIAKSLASYNGDIDERKLKKRKTTLLLGVVVNLALIGYFKYANFFASNIVPLFGASWSYKEILLPLGISFFTFQQIACLVDTYKGKIGVISFYKYALFVSFFPQLIAGPIVLADTLIPQFDNKRIFCLSWKNICIGITLFSIGLFKKVVIADNLSPMVSAAFGAEHALTFIEAWGGALAYTFQIYFDFSGYSDMALGLGRFFNIELPINFNSPYKSTSIIEFWRRWHITLSNFLRDYLYIPLGGNRKGKARRYVNLLITMLLGGLWHGAGWTFVIWGGMHGTYLAVNHLWREHRPFVIPRIVGWFITSLCVVVAWVFFRAESTAQALSILKGMVGINGIIIPPNYLPSFMHVFMLQHGISVKVPTTWTFIGGKLMVISFLVEFLSWVMLPNALVEFLICAMLPNANEWAKNAFDSPTLKTPRRTGTIIAIIFLSAIVSSLVTMNPTEFLYFNF